MEKSLLYKYFQGQTSDQETEEILKWIDADAGHLKELEKTRFLFDATLFSSEEQTSPHIRLWKVMRPVLGTAASIVFIIGCTLLIRHNLYTPAPFTQTITAPIGQQTELTLPDGSKVWLNSKTTLSYQTDFGSQNRNVRLNGEAYFEVTKNKKLPFEVMTASDMVKVKGTHFNVCAYRGSSLFETSLYQGHVDIYTPDKAGIIAHLYPGQCYQEDNGLRRITAITGMNGYNWRNGIISFANVTFPDLMRHLSNYYGIKIVISDQQLRNYRSTGKFRISDSIDHILDVIQKDQPFHYTYNYAQKLIIIK